MELVQGRERLGKQATAASQRRSGASAQVQPGGLAGWILGLMRNRQNGPRPVKNMRVLETLPLGGRRQLMLVSCGGERFLVGTGLDRVDTIVKVGAPGKPLEETCS